MDKSEALVIIGEEVMPAVREWWQEKTVKKATPELVKRLAEVWQAVLMPGSRLCVTCATDVKMALDVAGTWYDREQTKANEKAAKVKKPKEFVPPPADDVDPFGEDPLSEDPGADEVDPLGEDPAEAPKAKTAAPKKQAPAKRKR